MDQDQNSQSPDHCVEWSRGNFTVSCDPAKLDHAVIAQFLGSSYWAKGIPPRTVEKSLENSLCFALLDGKQQIGFSRVISDYANTVVELRNRIAALEVAGERLAEAVESESTTKVIASALDAWRAAEKGGGDE